ncbi:MAG: hypothetical protein AUK03_06420 [Anaerolineae bacterium CG2_30_64_16]|nr:MAG: hypothetical protein AUK03_06420 [Anaerolineae bacterium CG2_30_64_16]
MTTELRYPNNYVGAIVDGQVRIKHVTPELASILGALGAREQQVAHESVWVLDTTSDQALATLLSQLRDLGVLFADQPSGWPPAAVLEELRDSGYVQGRFQTVTWRGPGQWVVTLK